MEYPLTRHGHKSHGLLKYVLILVLMEYPLTRLATPVEGIVKS